MSGLRPTGELVGADDLAAARAAVVAARPGDEGHEGARAQILAFIDAHPDALHRSCLEGHLTGSAVVVDPATRQVHLDGGDVIRARTIILACGVAWRKLAIDGSDRLAGKGISYGAARSEAPTTHGQDIHIVGAGNSAGQAALFFSSHARSVTIVCRGSSLEMRSGFSID